MWAEGEQFFTSLNIPDPRVIIFRNGHDPAPPVGAEIHIRGARPCATCAGCIANAPQLLPIGPDLNRAVVTAGGDQLSGRVERDGTQRGLMTRQYSPFVVG